MTDQVRQFFLNGGQQAYIVRIGQGILNASRVLTAPSGTTLTLTALSGGQNGNNIRAIVDYDTADPERTFNLTVFRELTDPSGNTTTANQEIHQNLSMDANSPQFVETVLAQNSSLISGDVTLGAAGTTAISASGTLADDIIAAIDTFIPAGGQGKFKISLGGASFKTISIPKGALTDDASLATLINTQLGLTTPNTIAVDAVTAGTTPALEYLQLTANKDIALAPASDSDIAVQFGLGAAQGGVEIGLFSADRPPASGLVSAIGVSPSQTGADISLLQEFAASLKAGWTNTTSLALTGGSVPFAAIPGDRVTFPDTGAAAMRDTTAPGGVPSLLHVRDAMFAIAAAINGNSLGGEPRCRGSGIGCSCARRPGRRRAAATPPS